MVSFKINKVLQFFINSLDENFKLLRSYHYLR